MEKLKGWKTYGLAALSVVYAVSGFLLGHLDANAALQIIGASGFASTIRHALASKSS
jgi:hypothetical protein